MDLLDRIFLDYRNHPSRDSLVALLNNRQRTVYFVCLRTLRQAQDAEDAAQEVLLEIIRGAGRIREPRAFRQWVSKVALHTALDYRRRRDRRTRHEETRASMTPEPPNSAADAVHDALAHLDDDDRCLLVEKYFEGATLDQLAMREGLSTSGVGKRIDRAKERLKQRLTQAGLTGLVPGVDSVLESSASAGPAPDLVSLSAAVKSAAALAGGAAVGAKSVHFAIAAAVMLMLLLGGGAYLLRTGRPSTSPTARAGRTGDAAIAPFVQPNEPKELCSPDSTTERLAESRTAADPVELLARLDRFKAWLDKVPAKFKSAADVNRWFEGSKAEAEGLRELILSDPATFLAWLVRGENRTCASNLFAVTICGKQSMWDEPAQEFAAFPRELTDGLLSLLHGEDDFLRCAVLQFVLTVKDVSPAYRDRCLALLTDPYELVSDLASKILLTTGTLAPAEAGGIASYLERVKDFEKRANLMQSIGRVPREDIRDWMLSTLESQRFADPEGRLTYAALDWWLEPGRSPGAAFEDRVGRLLAATLGRVEDPNGYFYLLYGGVSLPLKEARSLLALASTGAPSEQLRRAATAMLALSDTELKDSSARRGAWLDAYWAE